MYSLGLSASILDVFVGRYCVEAVGNRFKGDQTISLNNDSAYVYANSIVKNRDDMLLTYQYQLRTAQTTMENIKKNIDDRHRRNLFKLSYMPCFHTEKYFE